ncbi:DMWD protein, partial [Polyodon spathula]|nr:DMWD protein [Polyodon spathula]
YSPQRLIDKSKVTCLKWLPESEHLFLASHASGTLYLYNVGHPCGTAAPQYLLLRQGDGFAVYTCKGKTPRNPLLRWAVGEGGLNEFAFSPDGGHLACLGQDGCLRVFHFDSMELQGVMKSYFGGGATISTTASTEGTAGHHHPPHGPALPRSLSRSNSLPHPAVTNTSKGQAASEGGTPFSVGRFATLSLQERKSDKSASDKEHKRYRSLGNISKSNDKINAVTRSSRLEAAKVLGTTLCPRLNDVPLLEPLVCKKIAHERLSMLMFLDDCIITACQEGLICTWARPGKAVSDHFKHSLWVLATKLSLRMCPRQRN